MSPQVQQYGQAQPAEQAEQLFKERFTQIAYSTLFSKFPDLAPDVVTFKIIETDPDSGKGVGAFIVLRENRPIYVPIVMIDGQLKPVEMFYYKDLNIFLPLDNVWLDEVSKMSLSEMGEGAEVPQDVPRDMSIRKLTTPPVMGGSMRYASDESHDHNIKKMFKEAQHHSLEIHPGFLNVLENAPKVLLDGVKLAFENHPPLLQKFAATYGIPKLVSAFQTGYDNLKTPQQEVSGKVAIFTKSASPDVLKQAFGANAGDAFSQILKQGYVVNDTRKGIHKTAIKVERTAKLDSPGAEGGWFRLYFADTPADIFFLIPWPKRADKHNSRITIGDRDTHRRPVEYLAINKDGKEAWICDNVMGERILDPAEIKKTPLYRLMAAKKGGDTPSPTSYGFFLNMSNKAIEATVPFEVRFSVDENGRKKVLANHGSSTWIVDDDPSRIRIDTVKEHELGFLPKNVKWIEIVKIKKDSEGYTDRSDYTSSSAYRHHRRTSLIKDPKLIMRWMNTKLNTAKAKPTRVKKAGINQWWIEKEPHAYGYVDALQKVATFYEVPISDAEGILKDAQENGRSGAYILDPVSGRQLLASLEKVAQPPMPASPQQGGMPPMPPQGGMPPQQGGMPPQQGGMQGAPPMDPSMDPSMVGMGMPMQQSPMSPTDLAIAETVNELKQQNDMQMQQQQSQMEQQQQGLQMQQEQTEQLIGVLEHIQQRTRDISGATGGAVPAGAEGSPATAAGMLAPAPEEGEEPPPMPMMEEGQLTAETISQQVNPEMVDQASGLNDEGMFDTAALAMLSSAPALKEFVAAYVPNMEKCVDNLGRVLLTLWLTEEETKKAIGDETYIMLEDKLRTVFKSLGDVILSLSHNAPAEQEQ
jgi:hypothetical protein